eukprot:TRINITY_DN20405_c0_g1_i1.p1 TRINITY_DN20405_c0_g1~~TRINITY_DN20405_c0_g1_i1.p1  ORF type:complete len:395 (+),score=112.00 TRINITY_DN20405_c0_g1_i1:86-1270(+)
MGVQADEIPLKIVFEKRGKVIEIRRRRVSPETTLENVKGLIAQYPVRATKLHYRDEDDDLIYMDSEDEWRECLRLWYAAGADKPLRLIVEARNPLPQQPLGPQEPMPPAPGAPEQPAKVAQPEPERQPPATELQPAPGAAEPAPGAAGALPAQPAPEANPSTTGMSQLQGTAMRILERLYGPQVFAKLSNGSVTPATLDPPADSFLTVTELEQPGDVDIDISTANLSRALNMKACELIDRKHYGEALDWLTYAIRIHPKDGDTHYNMGCVRALMGNECEAIHSLEQAVGRGYSAHEHMLSDPDLASLRKNERFLAVVGECQALARARVEPAAAPEQHQDPVPEPPQEEKVESAEEQGVNTIMEIGMTDRELARQLLARHGGNVTAAVESLLEGI